MTAGVSLAMMTCSATSSAASTVYSREDASREERFANPPASARLLPIRHERPDDKAKADAELAKLKNQGFGGFAGNVNFSSNYLENAANWETLRYTLGKARELGQSFWLYDEKGYPSGTAGGKTLEGHPEWEARAYLVAVTNVPVGSTALPPSPPGKYVATIRRPSPTGQTETVFVVTDDYIFDGTHAWSGVSKFKCHYPNLLMKEPTARFIELTHEAYRRELGPDLLRMTTSTFTDEPSLMTHWQRTMPYLCLPVSDELLDAYRAVSGHSLADDVPELVRGEPVGPVAAVRHRFWTMVGERVAKNYVGQLTAWATKNGILSGGHLLREELPVTQVALYGDFFKVLRAFSAPGCDVLTSVPATVSWMTSMLPGSAGELNGARRVMSEASEHRQRHRKPGDKRPVYQVSVREIVGSLNRQIWGGINTFTSYYRWQNITDREVRAINEEIGRTVTLMSEGRSAAEIALLYPADALMVGFEPQYYHVGGEVAQRTAESFKSAGESLFRAARPFLVVDAASIAESEIRDGRLVRGPLAWRAVVLPRVNTLPIAAARRLAAFARAGGLVIALGERPVNSDRAFPDAELAALTKDWVVLDDGKDTALIDFLAPRIRPAVEVVRGSPEPIRLAHRRGSEGDVFLVVNDSGENWRGSLRLAGDPAVRIWDPRVGLSTEAKGEVALDLPSFGAVVLTTSSFGAESLSLDFTKGVPTGGRLLKHAFCSPRGLESSEPTNNCVASGFELAAPLTHAGAFRFELSFVPPAGSPPRGGVLAWDDLLVSSGRPKDGFRGFQVEFREIHNDAWFPFIRLGFGDSVETVSGWDLPRAKMGEGVPVDLAFEYHPDGKVILEWGGKKAVRPLKKLGFLAPPKVKAVVGDRATCYYHAFHGAVRRVSIQPLPFDRYLVHTLGRAAFVRGESDAKIAVEEIDLVGGGTNRVEVPVETRVRPGWRTCRVRFGEREHEVRYGIGPQVAERLPLIMQNSNQDVTGPAEMGFTMGQYGDGAVRFVVAGVPTADEPQLPGIVNSLDEAVVCGLDFSLGAKRPTLLPPDVPPETFYRRDAKGEVQVVDERGKKIPQLEVGDPRVLRYVADCWTKWGELLGAHPALKMFLPYSEFRDRAFPSTNGDARRYKAETGREMPAQYTYGRVINGNVMRQRYPDGLVADDDPQLAFYRWYWSGGDGWPRYISAASDAVRAGVAKVAPGKTLETFWDPSVRCPPRWGSGGSVTSIGQWVYADPEPIAVAGPAEEVLAMAKGRPGQKAFVHTQLMGYRRKMAPPETTVENPPAWVNRFPSSTMCIAVPTDVFTEATWSMLAKPMDGYSFYPWGSLVETATDQSYQVTNPDLAKEVRRMLREVIAPLGPTLKRLKRLEPDVAVFENFTSVVMEEPFGYGWHAAPLSFVQRARLDPKVVYEETLLRDGFDGIKVLYAPGCGFVTRSMAEKLKEFRAKGGILIGDERLAKAVEADIRVTAPRFYVPPKNDYIEDMEALGIKPSPTGQNKTKTILAKRRMCEEAEKLRQALTGRYAARSDSSSADILVYNRRWKGVNYLVAVSDKRDFGSYIGQWGLVMEKGVPNEGWVRTKDEGVAAVYELSRGGEVSFSRVADSVQVPVRFETCDGRLFAFLPRRIAAVDASAVRQGDEIVVSMRVVDSDGCAIPALLPVEIRVFAADGAEVDGAGYFAAEDGVASARVTIRQDDPKGAFKVVCRDRASGLTKELEVR